MGAEEWDVFMLVPTGQRQSRDGNHAQPVRGDPAVHLQCQPDIPIPIKMTCAPQYMRVIAQQHATNEPAQLPIRGRHTGGRGCMAGNGFCFISHVGEVFGCGFLPIPAGNIREQSFKQIYQQSPLFVELRNHSLLKGKCGACEYKTICGGCRARALSIHKSHMEEEPYCVYTPKKPY